MLDEWYCEIAGREIGPLSSQQLKTMATKGQILPTDHVRRGGANDWVPAHYVIGLFSSAEPPSTASHPMPPPVPLQNLPSATSSGQSAAEPPASGVEIAQELLGEVFVEEPDPSPPRINGGQHDGLRSRTKHKRQQQMMFTLCTAVVAGGVVLLYLIWVAGGFDNSVPEAREADGFNKMVAKAAPPPPDARIEPQEKRPPASSPSAGKSKESQAAAVKPSADEKLAGGRSDVAEAKKSPEKPVEKPVEKEEPEQPDNEDESKWIDASTMSPAVFDKVQVDVLSATWQGTEAESPDAARLAISIRVRNTGVAYPVTFIGWSPTAAQQGVTLIDNRLKAVKAKAADAANTVDNMLPIKINPGKSGRDVLIFEAPRPKMKYLRLKLSAAAFGKEGTAQFKIPATMIEGTPPSPPKPAAAKPVEKPAPPKPAEKPKRPNGPGPSGNPELDFGIRPDAAPPQ
jgi:hypothetical protein